MLSLTTTSEYHIAFSRMALTDVPLSLFMLLGVFAGWKAMNDYMAENKLEVVKPQVEPKLAGPRRKDKDSAAAAAPGDAARAGKPAG